MANSEQTAKALNRLSELVESDLSPFLLLRDLLELATELCGIATGMFTTCDGDRIRVEATVGTGRSLLSAGDLLDPDTTFCAEIIRRGEPLIIEDAHQSSWREHPAVVRRKIARYIGFPIVIAGKTRGTLALSSDEPGAAPLEPEVRACLRLIAAWAGRLGFDASHVSAAKRPLEDPFDDEPRRSIDRPARALIIEDATTIRMLLEQVLERAGFTVHTAADGVEGLEAFHQNEPDLVIVDLHMPRMDGETALREIRARGKRVPVIVSSGFLDEETRRRLEGLQAMCLRKPYGAESLVRLATELLTQDSPREDPRAVSGHVAPR